MKKYQGKKIIEAEPMTLGIYKEQTGRDPYANHPLSMPDDAEGYHVRYKDGYESWSPKAAFDEAYRPCETFLDRLHIEHDELKERIGKLEAFIGTEKFGFLGYDARNLLQTQLGMMNGYTDIIEKRIHTAEKKEHTK